MARPAKDRQAETWAVVAGINEYPGFPGVALKGPLADATAFRQWLMNDAATPEDNILWVQKTPGSDDSPAFHEIERAFMSLAKQSIANSQEGIGFEVGRRLYIFMAGHGFALNDTDAGLFTADAGEKFLGLHVQGRVFADYFRQGGLFSEVILFMDCCRENLGAISPRRPSFNEVFNPAMVDRPSVVCGYATKFSWLAREVSDAAGGAHGHFTTALLRGLRGDAEAADAEGRVTPATLESYVDRVVRAATRTALGAISPTQSQAPQFIFDKIARDTVVLAVVNRAAAEIEVSFKPQDLGKTLRLFGADLKEITQHPIQSEVMTLSLAPGLYKLDLASDPSRKKLVEAVAGVNTHVEL